MTRSFITKAAMAATVATVVFAPGASQAQNTIFSFNGAADVVDPNGAANPLGGTLLIDFLTGQSVPGFGVPGTIVATSQTDLTGVVEGVTAGTIADLTVNNTGFAGLPVSPFVQIGSYTFTLTGQDDTPNSTFGPIVVTPFGSRGSQATFAVNGTVTGAGLNPNSTFTGIFTAQFASRNPSQLIAAVDAGTPVRTSFSAQFAIVNGTTIPEPSTYALMASGVAMLGAFARRRRQQA